MKDPNNPCLFCNIEKSGYVYENELAYAKVMILSSYGTSLFNYS